MHNGSEVFSKLVETIEMLRSENGCPWDRKQTISDLKTYLVEEVYELCDAIEKADEKDIAEECGDVLLNIVMIANILKEQGKTDIYNVIYKLREKIISRHPHVFGDKSAVSSEEALSKWQHSKKTKENKTLFSNISSAAPALERAYLIAKRVEKINFGFENDEDIINKLREETEELIFAIKHGHKKSIEQEAGDLLFTIVNLSVFKKFVPQDSLNKSCNKFLKRLQYIETRLDKEGKTFSSSERAYIETLWEESKDRV